MARKKKTQAAEQPAEGQGKMLTLTEVSRRTGISMPTLQKYKKERAADIPSEGKGRTQRYPEEAVKVFENIRKENMKKRGRPPKAAGAAGGRGARKSRSTRSTRRGKGAAAPSASTASTATGAAAASGGSEKLTLTEISKRTGISYPTLMRYVKEHGDQIPSEGEGRKRRYAPEAVDVFRSLRRKSRGGGRKPSGRAKTASARKSRTAAKAGAKAGGSRRTAAKAAGAVSGGGDLGRALERIEKRLASLEAAMKKPLNVKVTR